MMWAFLICKMLTVSKDNLLQKPLELEARGKGKGGEGGGGEFQVFGQVRAPQNIHLPPHLSNQKLIKKLMPCLHESKCHLTIENVMH